MKLTLANCVESGKTLLGHNQEKRTTRQYIHRALRLYEYKSLRSCLGQTMRHGDRR